jgi:hypothetical protein
VPSRNRAINEASLSHGPSNGLFISTSRSTNESPAFCSAAVHTAMLLTLHADNETWTALEKSDECEYLADAVESLWEKVLTGAGKLTGM